MSTMNRVAIYLGFVFFVMTAISYSNSAEAHHVQRVIVEHHYPQGVTQHGYGQHRSYHHGGHHGAGTCYRECFHQGVSPRQHRGHGRGHGHRQGHQRHGGTSIQFGVGVYDHRGNGFSFGMHQRR